LEQATRPIIVLSDYFVSSQNLYNLGLEIAAFSLQSLAREDISIGAKYKEQ